ncbi:helix-turn-helix transcriptional regulator [Pseudomonas sp. UBA2684]|uniref:helix-turn-helix transcriptional regulator n=1 Tax=Pseudomonas sp. UBA2684 TaxID=1947311 RepID=UPI0025F0CFE9|nr:AlpA family phage regulatory protein [Pseudomonas sp. UBA2684]|tara:strand:- start:411 stop:662 length:252 start_codon:yes stop_codon:yes gene_type:complete
MDREPQDGLTDEYVIVRLPEVLRITGLSKSTIHRLIISGDFPKQVPLTDSKHRNAPVGFVLGEIKAWIKQRVEIRDKNNSPQR